MLIFINNKDALIKLVLCYGSSQAILTILFKKYFRLLVVIWIFINNWQVIVKYKVKITK